MYLHLDPNFIPFTSECDLVFETSTFPGGEPHIRIASEITSEEVTITHRIKEFNDVGVLLIATNALRNMGVEKIHLVLPYFPGARQDRLMTDGEALTAKVYAELLNAQNYKTVRIFDPHSDVSPALINRCKVISNLGFIKQVCSELPKDLCLISPDGGALKKIYKLAQQLEHYPVIEASKTRDVRTGALSGFKVYTDDLAGKDCLLIDDICDGGGTFLGLAQELKAKNAGKLYLAISHGIFSKGLTALENTFERIYVTDSFQNYQSESLTQIRLNTLL